MPIQVLCKCGRYMQLPDAAAGRSARCPSCAAVIKLPTPEEDRTLIRWYCTCGQALKAWPKARPRAVNCPKCGRANTTPSPPDVFDHVTFVLDQESGILEPNRLCPKCGREVPRSYDRCASCGAPLKKVSKAAEDTDYIPESEYERDAPQRRKKAPSGVADLLGLPDETRPENPGERQPPAAAKRADETPAMPAPSRMEAVRARAGPVASEPAFPFAAVGGLDAVRAGALQVVRALPLYVVFGGLVTVLGLTHVLAAGRWASSAALGVVLSVLIGIVSYAAWIGFAGCVRDGIFRCEADVERLARYAVARLPMGLMALLVMSPLWIGSVAAIALLSRGILGLEAPLLSRALLALLFVLCVGLFQTLTLVPALTVLENTDAATAVRHALAFARRRSGDLLTMSGALALVSGGEAGVVWLLALAASPLVAGLPEALRACLGSLAGGFVVAVIMGQCLASVTLLYLSHVGDGAQLDAIRRDSTAARARSWVLGLSIAIIYAVAVLLSIYHAGGF